MKNIIKFFGIIALVAVIVFSIAACGGNSTGNGDDKNLIFNEDFDGTSLDKKKWALCPNLDRQGRSTWMDDMVSVNNGYLHIKLKRDPELGAKKTADPEVANNWIRTGGIRTRSKDWTKILFQNTYGYYEARIKFPKIRGTWGAFWLMNPAMIDQKPANGEGGTEIDIIETIYNETGKFQAALHWNGYGEYHKSVGSEDNYLSIPIDIYDGEFHIFAFYWKPSEYIFYVDDHELWRVDGGANFKNCGINKKPNYIKLTVESAPWAGSLPDGFTEAEMVVDYLRVYKQRPE